MEFDSGYKTHRRNNMTMAKKNVLTCCFPAIWCGIYWMTLLGVTCHVKKCVPSPTVHWKTWGMFIATQVAVQQVVEALFQIAVALKKNYRHWHRLAAMDFTQTIAIETSWSWSSPTLWSHRLLKWVWSSMGQFLRGIKNSYCHIKHLQPCGKILQLGER